MNNLIKAAKTLPVSSAPTPAISLSSVTLTVKGREIPLELRVTAPVTGTHLPIVLFSHGHGPSYYIPSKDGYAPLRDFLAEHGFAVIQPTHLNSKVAGLPPDAKGGPLFLASRVQDMKSIIDQLDEIEAQATFLKGRLHRSSIAALGHSLGALTVSSLLGAGTIESGSQEVQGAWSEPRIKAGVLLGPPGTGGKDDLTEMARDKYLFPDTDFSTMSKPALIVLGDEDHSAHLTTRGVDWHRDPFKKSTGEKDMLTLYGGGHGCGGAAAYDAKETDDEDPERLAIVQRMTWAYLTSALGSPSSAWQDSCQALNEHCSEFADVESRRG